MQLTPRYGGEPVLRMEPLLDDLAVPVLRQRARLAETLAGLDDAQWAAASRCEGWSVQDVIAHLVTTNQFWAFSIDAGLAGTPSTFLSTFDPVASPAQMVDAVRAQGPAETLAQFVESNEAFAAAMGRAAGDGMTLLAEAPPGHIAIGLVALHALWDGWVHERDIVVPLGLQPVVEDDEVEAAMTYAAALSASFLAAGGSDLRGSLVVRASDPDVRVAVAVGPTVVIGGGGDDDAVVITGDAVQVLEALSFRGPFPVPVSPEDRWILGGLATVFDTVV